VLHFTPRGEEEGPRGAVRHAPPLTDREVRAYLDIWPKLDLKMKEAAEAHVRDRTPVDVEAFLAALCAHHGFSPVDFQAFRGKIDIAVEAIRFENDRPARDEQTRSRIREKEEMAAQASGPLRKQLEQDVAALRKQLEAPGPAAAPADVALVRQYWAELDRLVPKAVAPRSEEPPR
jgi:hypothetical protein